MSNERLAEILNPDGRSALLRTLEVGLTAELQMPGEEHHPPGAVDYAASFALAWYPEEADEQELRFIEPIAADGEEVDDGIRFTVGEAHLVVVDLLNSQLFDALDAREADLAYLGGILFQSRNNGEFYEIEEEVDSAGAHAVLVNSVTIDAPWRGMKLGLLAIGTALTELGRGCSFAALDAMEPGAEVERRQSTHKRLTWYWRQLGFSSWRERVMILDLETTELSDSLTRLANTPNH